MDTNYPILDSHIHLFPASELTTLAWNEPSNPLYKQYSLDEYTAATASASSSLEGFIFLETDRINDLAAGEKDGSGWTHPLQEVSWLKRIALGLPREGEGHTKEHAKLCKAIVPWAPVPSGAEVLERYVERVREEAGEAWEKVRGFRFLVQDKARGTMLEEKFIEGVKWLGKKGFVFDLGVDLHSGGKWQLEEAAQMMDRVHDGVSEEERVTVVISELWPFSIIYEEEASSRFCKAVTN
ncbi:L-rhamnono-gamma-lactonase [Clarireedia jacksonii]